MPVLIAPEGATSFSHAGETYEVLEDGTVEVPEDAVVTLMDHGFTPFDVEAEADDNADESTAPAATSKSAARRAARALARK